MALNQWFSTVGDFAPQGHLAMSGDIFDCHYMGGAIGILWIETGMLLNVLQCTGQPPGQRITGLQCHRAGVEKARSGWRALSLFSRYFYSARAGTCSVLLSSPSLTAVSPTHVPLPLVQVTAQ